MATDAVSKVQQSFFFQLKNLQLDFKFSRLYFEVDYLVSIVLVLFKS